MYMYIVYPPTPPPEGSKVCENFKRVVGWRSGVVVRCSRASRQALSKHPPALSNYPSALSKHSPSTLQAPLKPYPPPGTHFGAP